MKFLSVLLIIFLGSLAICGCRAKTFHSGYNGKFEKVIVRSDFTYPQRHSVHIDSVFISNDLLTLRINYSGGCKSHFFRLYSNGKFTASSLPEVKLFLDDTVRTDNCRQFREEVLTFDISELKHKSEKKVLLKFDDGYNVIYSY